MRVAPVAVALFADEPAVVRVAEASARITHAHPHGIDGAVVQAVAVAAALRGEDPVDRALAAVRTEAMRERLGTLAAPAAAEAELDPRRLTGEDWQVGFTAVAAVPVAVVIGGAATTFEQAITVGVRCGGDTDTVAAMAGAVAGVRFGAGAIPPHWYEALEDGARGRSHVERLVAQLLRLAA
jgi:ADP-ribosyl-[dinitrogen reductase] hydrolase